MDALTFKREREQNAQLAREQFIAQYCRWWPAAYKSLLPLTTSAAELLEAKAFFERDMRDAIAKLAAYDASPWIDTDRLPGSILDWEGVPAQDRIAIGMQQECGLGMPAPVKPGFEDHPAVREAWARAPRTREAQVHEQYEVAEKALREKTSRYVELANSQGEHSEAALAAEKEVRQAEDAIAAIQAEQKRLRLDRTAACELVK